MALYKSVYYYYYFLTPVLNSQGMKTNYAIQYKKVQKSSWNEPYTSCSNSHAVTIIVIENCDKWVKTDWLLRS